jgi:WhiB family redox-sensing transcriptional regulator
MTPENGIDRYAPDWWDGAECRGIGYGVFFGEDGAHTSLKEARQLCGACPVARKCLEHALLAQEEYGIWAGTSARNRAYMIKAIEGGKTLEEVIDKVIGNRFRWRDE